MSSSYHDYRNYRGRFAPSPTGALHLGSLLAAVGSYLQAKHHNGQWFVRIEDLDPPREIKNSANNILHCLDKFGLHWDGPITYQSQRNTYYREALAELQQKKLLYPCECSRKTIRSYDPALGKIGYIYPGTCRDKKKLPWNNNVLRIKVCNKTIVFHDLLQGTIKQNLSTDIGDINLKRRDGLFAYHIAVIVDDYQQEITEIVRGFDLLACTPIQIYLQQCLNYRTPNYVHLPIVVDHELIKLSKQTGAISIEDKSPIAILIFVLRLLGQNPPIELRDATQQELLNWARIHWNIQACNKQTIQVEHDISFYLNV